MRKKKTNTIPAAEETSILVVDDHPIVCDGLADLINHEADLVAIARAGTIAEAVKAVKEHQIDFAIVDMLLKNETGIHVTKTIKALCPDIFVLIFSMRDELIYIKQAFERNSNLSSDSTNTNYFSITILDSLSLGIISACLENLSSIKHLAFFIPKITPYGKFIHKEISCHRRHQVNL